MIAAVGVVVDVFKATKEIFVAIAEIQKGLVVEEQFQAGVRADNAGDIAIVIDRADAATQIGGAAAIGNGIKTAPTRKRAAKINLRTANRGAKIPTRHEDKSQL